MKSLRDGYGYNERLFAGGIRSMFHLARFKWFISEIKKRNCVADSVLELGCFDGKLIDFLPRRPSTYIGFDANWEGGLDKARVKWAGAPNFGFHQASSPDEMRLDNNSVFDIAVAMETLEHVPPEMVEGYLRKIAQHLEGYLFVSVPNEKGIVFLTKWLAKKLLTDDAEHYTFAELTNATLGRMGLVARREHKGFDYESLVKNIDKHFDVIDISGMPFGVLHHSLCFGIGIIAKSRRTPRLSNSAD